ncbi:MAG: YqgE/AlgH family protein [Burkholderiaceae bacterium]
MAKHSKTSIPPLKLGTPQDTPDFSDSPDMNAQSGMNLANHFLIAMPSMLDPVFGGTVIYLCEHNANGALGVIINKPTDMTMDVLLDRIDLKLEIAPNQKTMAEKPVMFGGPVQVERGFVLHTPLKQFSSMMKVTDDVTLTTSKDVLEAVASGQGPKRMLVTLGCAGWSAGQLEDEIARNGWLTVCADPSIMFDLPVAERFVAAIKLLGIDPMMLASEAGHA